MRTLRPRERRLLLIAFFLACIVPFAPLANSQLRHLRQVRNHISRIAPEWEEFRSTNSGFERVHLFAYTGGDGMFGAYGEIWSDADLAKLRRFMESTMPPRPVYLGAVHEFNIKDDSASIAEPVSGANGASSQRSEP